MKIVNNWDWQENNVLVFRPWLDEGITHGITGIVPFRETYLSIADYARLFSSWYPDTSLLISHQVHGSIILEISKDTPITEYLSIVGEGDAIIAPRINDTSSNQRRAIAVQTADCAPILIVTELDVAVVHAGWRGLASGIIKKTVQKLFSRGGKVCRAVVGPAATTKFYEVGSEVIEAIGTTAEAIKKNDTQWFLDVGRTALNQCILALGSTGEGHLANICTIEDLRFYSYRRSMKTNTPLQGRNVSFIFC